MKLSRLLALIIKEFMAIWKDPRSRAMVTIMPLFQMILFSTAVTMEVKNIDMAVLDESRSYYSRELISRFAASPWFKTVRIVDNRAELVEAMDTQAVSLALELPVDFAKHIATQKPTQALIVVDGRQTNAAALAGGYASQIVSAYNQELLGLQPRLDMRVRNWFNINLDYLHYALVSLFGMLSMAVVLLLTSLSVAREREMGTFDQLIVSPLSSTEILIGKAVPPLLLAWTLTMVMLTLGVICFDFPLAGSLPLFMAADFVALLALVGVGLFISSLCKTQQQAILGVMTFQMPAVLLSGFTSPVANMPEALQYLTCLNPLRFFLVIAKGVLLKDMQLADVLANLVPLAIIAALTLSLAGWTFNRKLE